MKIKKIARHYLHMDILFLEEHFLYKGTGSCNVTATESLARTVFTS